MVERIFTVTPHVAAPDYGNFIRRSLGAIRAGAGSFTRALEQERAGESQSSVSPGESGIALDPRSLATLQRLARYRPPAPQEEEEKGSPPVKKAAPSPEAAPGPKPGRLSAQYESGSRGIAAIGHDRIGGTSYGKYQISSRQGSFSRFLSFLADKAPDLAERLGKAGNADTGSRRGAVPEEWQAIAAEQPERFEKLQEDFISDSYYKPALEGISEKLGLRELSHPVREVLWSTAVQHGPKGALLLFEQAVRRLAGQGKSTDNEKALIETVYSLRKTRFTSSSPEIQAAVLRRFDQESRQALAMLEERQTAA
jgi:hypothetical protein